MPLMLDGEKLLQRLPKARGRLEANFPLADLTWFRAGGPAEVLFTPADEGDLAGVLQEMPEDIPVYVIGVGSNLRPRDRNLGSDRNADPTLAEGATLICVGSPQPPGQEGDVASSRSGDFSSHSRPVHFAWRPR